LPHLLAFNVLYSGSLYNVSPQKSLRNCAYNTQPWLFPLLLPVLTSTSIPRHNCLGLHPLATCISRATHPCFSLCLVDYIQTISVRLPNKFSIASFIRTLGTRKLGGILSRVSKDDCFFTLGFLNTLTKNMSLSLTAQVVLCAHQF
jgi:hypothetical protein